MLEGQHSNIPQKCAEGLLCARCWGNREPGRLHLYSGFQSGGEIGNDHQGEVLGRGAGCHRNPMG